MWDTGWTSREDTQKNKLALRKILLVIENCFRDIKQGQKHSGSAGIDERANSSCKRRVTKEITETESI